MHFSVITPAPGREREAAYERLGGPYAEHQWLWRFFSAPPGTSRDFLFRRWDAGGLVRFYVLSQRLPRTQNGAWSLQTREYAPKLKTGMRFYFDLRANPTVSERRDGKVHRHDVVMQEKKRLLAQRGIGCWREWQGGDKPDLYSIVRTTCSAWLQSRATRNGFEVDLNELAMDAYEPHSQDKDLKFTTVDFSGALTVVDPQAFGAALCNGIGRAKAFGCGLLLIRPA
jgi:CRISPR system Cascade subunit CasE